MDTDLNRETLYRIMGRLAAIGAKYPGFAMSADLLEFLTANGQAMPSPQREDYFKLNRYLIFLKGEGYVEFDAGSLNGNLYSIRLTSRGQTFVQPELAEFGRPPMLPLVVNYIENRIDISQRPDEEKAGMKFKLHEALANAAPELLAKVIVELGSKFLGM